MSNLLITILAAILLMILVTAALAVGLLITGRSRLKRGCGYTPDKKGKKNGDENSSSCPVCGEKEVCKKEEKDDNNDS